MKIEIPRVVRRLELGGYAPEYGGDGAVIWVWVNPPRKRVREYFELLSEAGESIQQDAQDAQDMAGVRAGKVYAWLAEMWSQAGLVETLWTAEEVGELARETLESDPGLWAYVTGMTVRMILDYRDAEKKAWRRA